MTIGVRVAPCDRLLLLVCVALVWWGSPAAAQEPAALHARRAAVPPRLDGVLDDDLWTADPLPLGAWVSYNPLRGEPAQQATSIWIRTTRGG